jgi:adenylate kinase family enzyme
MLGRRLCGKCGGNFNINAVHVMGFDLPAQLPCSAAVNGCDGCCSFEHFSTRMDDVPHIVEERLETHYAVTDPILDYYHKKGRLLRFAPHQGYKDVPRFQRAIETWLTNMDENEKRQTF